MTLKIILSLSFILLSGFAAMASIPHRDTVPQIEKILAKKGPVKFEELKRLGPGVYADLRKMTFNPERTLGLRWEAFMAMVRLGEKESLPEIDTALQSSDWFLRDAALKVLPVLDKDRAYKAAMVKLNDSALVVRTTAVDVLGRTQNPAAAEKLWGQLYSKDNYIKHQSLWIRRHIVEALADISPAGSEGKFIKVLDDADSSLFGPAIKGLERLTHKKLGDENVPPVYRRYFWKKWYKENSNKT